MERKLTSENKQNMLLKLVVKWNTAVCLLLGCMGIAGIAATVLI